MSKYYLGKDNMLLEITEEEFQTLKMNIDSQVYNNGLNYQFKPKLYEQLQFKLDFTERVEII